MRAGEKDRLDEVARKSGAFRKELGLGDLVLTQILYVVGSSWVGTAAKLGTAHIVMWLLAIALYYLPQAAVVIWLNRSMPLEGGPYQWTHTGLGRFWGFLTAWNLWAYAIIVMAQFAVTVATSLSYVFGGVTAGWYTPVVSTLAIAGATLISILGLRTSKWMQNIGGAAQVLTFAALIVVPFVALGRGDLHEYHPLAASAPALTALNLNLFGKMAVGALSGFEYVAILAGETRSPGRTINRSVMVAAPIIALMFILGTSSTLALVPNDQIDLVSPIPQTLTVGFRGMGFAGLIVPALIGLLLLRQIGSVLLIFAGNVRLPMVAGWDGLLPSWFSRLHPRYRTPQNSILLVGAITLAFTLAGQIGVGVQEAFQLLENAAGILYAFLYLALFAIPLLGARHLPERPPLWLRLVSLSGFAVTCLYSVLSVFPIIEVTSWQIFSAKIVAVLLLTEILGVTLYLWRSRRQP